MKASDLFVKCLENEGVQYIFGVPGEENLDFLDSLRSSSIKLVVTRHEQTAGFMAATVGRLTGKAGVCLSTLGPGATNLVTPAAYAQLGGMPLCILTGQKPIHSSKQGHFQIIDTVSMFRPLTKYTRQLTRGDRIAAVVREAFKIAEAERPGAVHIELPEDVAVELTKAQPFDVYKVRRPDANVKAVALAEQWLHEAKRPLVLIGAGANRKLVSKTLFRFLEVSGIYFFNTQMGKGVIAENHPQCLGTAALSDRDYLHCAIERADLILNIGHDVVEKPPFFMRHNGTRVIHINFSAAEIDEVYFPQHEIVGDIANALWQLSERIQRLPHWDFSYFEKVRMQVLEKLAEKTQADGFPLAPQRIVADVRTVLAPTDILALDNGMYKLWFARNYPALAPNTLLLDNALATMGAGLPSAMAAKLLFPERHVVAICGDGGFMMNSQDLETAVRLGLSMVVIVLNDSAYGMIQWKQHSMGLPDFGLAFRNPDFVKYAESYGANGHRVSTAAQFQGLLQKCLNTGGVHMIDLPIDYTDNIRVFTKELSAKSCIV